jgi:hypothetical protein
MGKITYLNSRPIMLPRSHPREECSGLVVVDEHFKLKGVLTLSDILHYILLEGENEEALNMCRYPGNPAQEISIKLIPPGTEETYRRTFLQCLHIQCADCELGRRGV